MVFVLEYIWIDGSNNLRSKTKITQDWDKTLEDIPLWNYDGSSTGQGTTKNSEVLIKPIKFIKDPFMRSSDDRQNYFLVLCETLNTDETPHISNTRNIAQNLFSLESQHSEPMFGIEQEFFISRMGCGKLLPIGFPMNNYMPREQGDYYCGVGGMNILARNVINEVRDNLIYSEIPITGLNAEVAPSQWEFQVCDIGISAADNLYLLRYICNRTLERYSLQMDIAAKPVNGNWNGSGCHVNYSTDLMRESGGIKYIKEALTNLSKNHDLHIKNYGSDNHLRLTGEHETSSMSSFSTSVGGRNTSIRIPSMTKSDKCGYFEDRRPSSSMDPYIVTALLHCTSCGINQNLID